MLAGTSREGRSEACRLLRTEQALRTADRAQQRLQRQIEKRNEMLARKIHEATEGEHKKRRVAEERRARERERGVLV